MFDGFDAFSYSHVTVHYWAKILGFLPSYWSSGPLAIVEVGLTMGLGIVLYRVFLVWFKQFLG